MAVQNTYLINDGDLGQGKRKRAGESLMIDAVPQPAPAANVPGDPARAARMQAQFSQPVTVGWPVAAGQPAARPAPDSAGLNRMVGGALSIAPAAIWEGAKNLGTDVANVGRSIIDAEQVPRPGYPRTSQLSQEIAEGASAFAGANRNLAEAAKGSVREVTGSAPVAKPVSPMLQRDAVDQSAKPATAPAPSQQQAAAPPDKPAQPQANPAAPGYMKTGIGGDRAGGEIVARRGAGGVMEFTNENATPGSVASASPMPADGFRAPAAGRSAPGSMVAPDGARTLASGSNYQTDAEAFARRGSVANIGNGIGGGLSVGQAGDAAMALGRFERANQEREKMVQISRRGQIGEGGGRVTIVRDSSRSPSIADIRNARLDARQAQTNLQNQQAQQGILAGLDERLTNQLNRQKTQQEIETGRAGLENQQRIADLRSMIADTTLPVEQRQAAEQAYNALTLSPADRYMTVQGGTNEFGGKDASKVFDRLTGQEVGANGSGQPRRAVTMSEIEATAKNRGMSTDQVMKALKAQGVTIQG